MAKGNSTLVRRVADRDYVNPAMADGGVVRIRVGDLEKTLMREGFPARHINQICSALESDKFSGTRLELRGGKGKPRKVDTIYEFKVRQRIAQPASLQPARDPLLELRGVLKGAIREGADAFLRELRRDKAVRE
jgi:hypothetical protein